MTHKVDFHLASSEAVENALGNQIEAIRLAQNMTQSTLAREAGISRSTITRLAQGGKGISLDSFIRILKALHLAHNLEALLPDPQLQSRPLEALKKAGRRPRQRARARKQDQKKWTWKTP